MDTIYAPATARGRAGVSIVRLSGPAAWEAVCVLTGPLPAVRQAALRTLRWEGEELDQVLVLLFAQGGSFTGEEVAELHLHGSLAVVSAVLRALAVMSGLRLAEPGEFSRRALENGCLDLAQIEGLGDLIDAETEAQRRQALRVLSGAVGRRAEVWRGALIRAAALLEATIDFADDDVPLDVMPEVTTLLDSVLADLYREADGARAAERVRDGYEVAIVGLPNAGKSTLLNALVGREAAITSEVAGTTRDVIEVRMDLVGLAVTVLDTAGLRDTDDVLESIGIARAIERAKGADLRVFLQDINGLPDGLLPVEDDIVVLAKADSGGGVSGKTGAGVAELVAQISGILAKRAAGAATITRERHRLAVMVAIGAMESAKVEIVTGARVELMAEHVRSAIKSLDSLVGRVDVEHVLGEIFASFCIGK